MAKHDNLNDIDKTIDEIINSTKQRNEVNDEIAESIAKGIDKDIENDINPGSKSADPTPDSADKSAKKPKSKLSLAKKSAGSADENGEKPAKKGVKLNTAKKIIIIAAAVIVVFAAVFGGIAIKTQDNPFTYTASVIKNSKADLIGNWESDSAPGLSAYTFNEDGSYDSYISSYNFSGKYTATPNTLTLINTLTSQQVVYKYSISGDTLKLTLIEENGKEVEDDETVKYNKVDQLNQKTISDIVSALKSGSTETD